MSVVSVRARSFILALFIRDDGERFLLGDRGFDFKDSQLHFSANNIENDEVAKQGVDGVMLAGQVRRASVQSFDGYVGDATTLEEEVEQMRRDFIAFFAKGHHFRVIYIDCNRNAWQRKGGYLVDAPEVKELWQIHPEYHVGLNFEDVNYYEYDENADGQEILANIMKVPISRDVEGGLVWDENGAVSEPEEIEYDTETATASGNPISIADAVEAPLKSLEIQGETSQNGTPTPDAPVAVQTVTGEQTITICGKNLVDINNLQSGSYTSTTGEWINYGSRACTINKIPVKPNSTYVVDNHCTNGYYMRNLIDAYRADGSFISRLLNNGLNGSTFTTTADTAFVNLTLSETSDTMRWADYQTDFANGTIQPQIELGSTATDYEPYQGQSYTVNLGKNLLSIANSTLTSSGVDITRADGYINASGTVNASWGFNIAPGNNLLPQKISAGTYTISLNKKVNFNILVIFKDASGTEITSTTIAANSLSATATLARDAVYYLIWSNSGTGTVVDVSELGIQLEKGSTATSYAAYFTPIELCKIGDYQDYIYKSGDKWYVHKEVGKILSYAGETISTDYISTTGSLTTGATIYYVLATPTDTEITNEALVAQLEAILNGGTSAGTNNITTIISAGNAQGELEITYYTKYDAKVVGGGYVWEAGGSGGPTIVTNESISAVSPVWTVFGPALNPMLENTTTGEQIQYVGMISEGQTLVVDMGEQTASLDGLNVISNIVGEYLTLAPGSNTLLFSADSDAPASEIGWSEIVG